MGPLQRAYDYKGIKGPAYEMVTRSGSYGKPACCGMVFMKLFAKRQGEDIAKKNIKDYAKVNNLV